MLKRHMITRMMVLNQDICHNLQYGSPDNYGYGYIQEFIIEIIITKLMVTLVMVLL